MTTFLYQNGYFYADSRAYVNGQPFNISGKIVALDDPIRMKGVLDKGSVKPIQLDETIYGYFVIHAVDPGRAFFKTLLTSAQQSEGDIQGVLDNYVMFLEHFKLAAYDAHFTLVLIGETGTYCINTPRAINDEFSYQFAAYVSPETKKPLITAFGANHEFLSIHVSAGYPVILAYYNLFLNHVESGGNVERFMIRKAPGGKKKLVHSEFYAEASTATMEAELAEWHKDENTQGPIPIMASVFHYGPPLLSGVRMRNYLKGKGYSVMCDENEVATHLVPRRGPSIDLRERQKKPKE